MDVLMECCCGEDIHKDMVKACIIQGWLEDPSIYLSSLALAGSRPRHRARARRVDKMRFLWLIFFLWLIEPKGL